MSKSKTLNPLTMTDEELIKHCDKQVQALRMALDMIECEKYERRHVRWAIIDALKEWKPAFAERPAQPSPVQEPVAWISHNAGLYHFKPDESLDPLPLYLAPPAAQRQWVGLTDEEIDNIDYANWSEDYQRWNIRRFARFIEAKLKELNT